MIKVNQQKQKHGDVWKWLFFTTAIIYLVHSWRDYYKTIPLPVPKELPPSSYMTEEQLSFEDRLVLQLKENGQVGKDNAPYNGKVNGRPFIIYNNTGHINSMINQLHKYRQSPTLKKNQLLADYGEKKVPHLRFLHLPKAGKAFAISMVHYCCLLLDDISIDVNVPSSAHAWKIDPSCRRCMMQPTSVNGDSLALFPYLPDLDKDRVITLMRDPLVRLSFQLDHMRRLRPLMTSYGFTPEEADLLGMILSGKIITAYKKIFNTENILDINFNLFTGQYSSAFLSKARECAPIIQDRKKYPMSEFDACRFQLVALYPGLLGCQTKLIIGRTCVDKQALTQADVDLAKERIKNDFLFTGIYERWNQSVAMLHKKIGGKLFLDELRLPYHVVKVEEQRVQSALTRVALKDPFDEEVYAYANSLFEEEANKVLV